SSLAQAVAFVPLYLIGVLAVGTVAMIAERHDIDPGLTFGGNDRTHYGGLAGISGPYPFHRKVFREFIDAGLPTLGVLGTLIFLYLILRTFVQSAPPTPERRD